MVRAVDGEYKTLQAPSHYEMIELEPLPIISSPGLSASHQPPLTQSTSPSRGVSNQSYRKPHTADDSRGDLVCPGSFTPQAGLP